MKPLFIEDFTPIIKDITNTKIIRIEAFKNKLETTVGQELGLDIKLEMESEGGLLDKKALMDTTTDRTPTSQAKARDTLNRASTLGLRGSRPAPRHRP